MSNLHEILREQRRRAKLTRDRVGAAVGLSGASIAAFEQGRTIPQPDTARLLDELFKTGDEIQRAATAARDDARPTWLRPWTDHEQRATLLRSWEPLLMPGLLQVEEYARAVLHGGWVEDAAVERTIQVRHDRQAATVNRPSPPALSAIISEFALMCAPPELRGEQLKHLLEISQRPRVQVLVVPRSAGLHGGLQGAFVLATLPGRGRAGYVDDQLRGRVVTEGRDLDQLEVTWEIVTGLALPVRHSRDLIAKAINDYD